MPEVAAATAAEPAAPKLDDLMLAMDVVDTLRHQDQLVAKELGQEERDRALKTRLREIYESQGLAVTDQILDQGIAALKESRFAYTPPRPGFDTFLARLWIRRGAVGVAVAVVLVVLFGLWGWQSFKQGAAQRAANDQRIAITETLPAALRTAGAAAIAAAIEPSARAEAERLLATGETAVTAGDAEAIRASTARLDALRADLNRTYRLRIVARPGEETGVFRIPDVNEDARNYYIIVEAVDDAGGLVSLPVVSEEDGKTSAVGKWGVRVPQATFDAVRADKSDDGIVEANILGEKKRGFLTVDYLMPVESGAITAW